MKRLLCWAALAASIPASAQEALTPDEELQCGLLMAAGAGMSEEASAQVGGAALMSYFFGRYEGRTGKRFDDSEAVAVAQKTLNNAAEIAPRCQAAGQSLGTRMQNWAKSLQTGK